jgi:acyl phosphate:glycerol-3-phosphate acyltransferase
MAALAVAILAYLLGCFSTGYYLVRLRTGQDLRTVGSGATGGRNVARVLGPAGFVVTGAGDLLKAAIAVAVPIWLDLGPLAVGAAIVGVTAGHIWPIQLGFHGGKGVAPFVGTTALVAPIALAVGAIVAALFVLGSRRLNLGGIVGFALTPFAALALGTPLPIVGGIAASVAFMVVAHRANLRAELGGAAPAAGTIRLPFGRALRPVSRGGRGDG